MAVRSRRAKKDVGHANYLARTILERFLREDSRCVSVIPVEQKKLKKK
jgi:hypothetical protein